MNREIVILSGVRTAIGGYGGSLKDIPPSDLAAMCVKEAVTRSEIDVKDVGHVVFGNVIHTDAHDHYLARVAGIKGGLPHETPALTLNRLCGSGLQAIVTAAQAIVLGDAEVTVAGGAENMSRAPYSSQAMRFGARMNDTKLVDMMVGALSDPFDDCHMGVTAENVAKKYNVSREDQDALAAEPSACRFSDRSRIFQSPDRSDRDQGQAGQSALRDRRDRAAWHHRREARQAAHRIRSPRLRDSGQRIQHQRCGGGCGAGRW